MNYGHHVRELLLELKRSEDGSSMANAFQSNNVAAAAVAIPTYNDNTVSNALQDFKLHVQALQEQVEAAALAASSMSGSSNASNTAQTAKPSLTVRPSILLQNAACQRNKRGLLAYHWIRLQRIQELLYWQSNNHRDNNMLNYNQNNHNSTDGDNDFDDVTSTDNVMNHLCPAEIDFLHQYHKIISQYTTSIELPDITDLRAHSAMPPLTVDRVLCRVVDATPFMGDSTTTNNTIVLESGQSVNFTLGSTHYLIYSDCEEYVRSGALQLLETEET
jgi:hypothetical protein